MHLKNDYARRRPFVIIRRISATPRRGPRLLKRAKRADGFRLATSAARDALARDPITRLNERRRDDLSNRRHRRAGRF